MNTAAVNFSGTIGRRFQFVRTITQPIGVQSKIGVSNKLSLKKIVAYIARVFVYSELQYYNFNKYLEIN